MWVSRVRVNGGFLAGLDVQLDRGLNVVVGARGAGKTTLLELIRHALGIPHADVTVGKAQQNRIAQLLGSGEVVLEIEDENSSTHLVVDAAGNGHLASVASQALALGQNELEGIASNSASRLRLIDMRTHLSSDPPARGRISTLTEQFARVRAEFDRMVDTANREAVLRADRELAAAEETRLLREAAVGTAAVREELRELEGRLLGLQTQASIAQAASQSLENAETLGQDFSQALFGVVPSNAGLSINALLDSELLIAQESLQGILARLKQLDGSLVSEISAILTQQNEIRVLAEPMRSQLEQAEAGLGQVTARLRNIDAELTQVALSGEHLIELQKAAARLVDERDLVFENLEAWQESLFEARRSVGDEVSNDLHHRVVVTVEHLGDTRVFRTLLETLLQGSGLQYRSLAESLSKSVLPRQLLDIIERNDIVGLGLIAGVTTDRAARIVAHLSAPERVIDIAGCSLDDEVDFRLRDGATEKSVEQLSTGQKCAVTLPIVLLERSRVLILDQPEDHLDNAYLVDNIVGALLRRSEGFAQTIVATHNANIPVLGSAPSVIVLESDGVNGYVGAQGPYDTAKIVDVITSLMEGGRQAFERRAHFYATHGETS